VGITAVVVSFTSLVIGIIIIIVRHHILLGESVVIMGFTINFIVDFRISLMHRAFLIVNSYLLSHHMNFTFIIIKVTTVTVP